MYDVITLGETMLRLSPANGSRIEQATQFDIHVGGSESNTAVGLARLGHRVAWLSRLTDNSLGRMLAASIAGHRRTELVLTTTNRGHRRDTVR